MKSIVIFLASVVLASLFGFVLAETFEAPTSPSSEQIKNEWTAEEHLNAANLFEETAARLESKVGHLEQRVERYIKKPYLDPKGFKVQGWKRLMGSHRAELSELREQIAWHYGQANRISAMPVSEEKEKVNNDEQS